MHLPALPRLLQRARRRALERPPAPRRQLARLGPGPAGLKAWLDANRRPGRGRLPRVLRDRRAPLLPAAGEAPGLHQRIPRGRALHPARARPLLRRGHDAAAGLQPHPRAVDDRAREGIPGPAGASSRSFGAYAEDPGGPRRARAGRSRPRNGARGRDRFLHLRFARLCYYLRVRRPDAVIGYSIFIYRLDADEVSAATAGSLSGLERADRARGATRGGGLRPGSLGFGRRGVDGDDRG